MADKRGGDLGQAHARISASPGDWMGYDAAIDDFDGDGQADLAIGAPRDYYFALDVPGRVAIFVGPVPSGSMSFDGGDLVFSGSDDPDGFGFALDAGDVDGDGLADLVIGAPFDSTHLHEAGAVRLFLGSGLWGRP